MADNIYDEIVPGEAERLVGEKYLDLIHQLNHRLSVSSSKIVSANSQGCESMMNYLKFLVCTLLALISGVTAGDWVRTEYFPIPEPKRAWKISAEGTEYYDDCIDRTGYIITRNHGIALTHTACGTTKSQLGFKER